MQAAFGDFNGDGQTWLAALGPNALRVRSADRDSVVFALPHEVLAGGPIISMAVGDIDLDGDDDIAYLTEGGFVVGKSLGCEDDCRFEFSARYDADLKTIALRDMDGDGYLDVVGLATGRRTAQVHYLQGDAPVAMVVVDGLSALDTASKDMGIADLDGDGFLDLVFAGADPLDVIGLALSRAQRTFMPTAIVPFAGDPNGLIVTDFNADGAVDVIATPENTVNSGDVAVWLRPAPQTQMHWLTDMHGPVSVPPGQARTLSVGAARMFLRSAGMRVHATTALTDARFVLTDPSGQAVDLGGPPANTTTLLGLSDVVDGDVNRWLERGEWQLEITNTGAEPLVIDDFAMVVRGDYQAGCEAATIDGASYLFCAQKLTFDDARAYCQRQGRDLVVPNTDAKNRAVFEHARRLLPSRYWIGLTDREVARDFRWIDDSPVTDLSFNAGQPNHLFAEECVYARVDLDGGRWHDARCGLRNTFVCE